MAEARRFADLKYGHAGTLTYTPNRGEAQRRNGDIAALHSSHVKADRTQFKQIDSVRQTYAASCSKPPPLTHSHLWAERQLQKRWLQKSHPEASDGISSIPEVLSDEIQRFRQVEENPSPKPILAVGEMVDLTIPSKPGALPVLATAAGETGEMLRLTRMEDSEWSWDGRQECTMRMPAIDHEVEVDEVVWGSGGLPITQLKFAQSANLSGTARWLLVQKQTATMMFRPEFSKVPKTRTVSYQTDGPMLSRINPKLILTLNHRQTGGNAHADMAFNPPDGDRPPQLCVIDECGYWTTWNLASRGRMGREAGLTLYKGGHLWEGLLSSIPSTPQFPAEVHGILFLGTREEETVLNISQDESPSKVARSKFILMWNSEHLRIVDVEEDVMLPEILGLVTTKSHHGHVVNVRLSAIDPNHFYVLTERYLMWVELVSLKTETGHARRPMVRLTCPHLLPGGPHLKMSILPYSSPKEGDGTLIHVYSSSHDQISAHWFHVEPLNKRPRWHSHLLTITTEQPAGNGSSCTFRDLLFLPLSIDLLPRARGPGPQYLRQDVRFFQGWLVGHDLSVHYCMCTTSTKPELEVVLPHERLNWTRKDKFKKTKHRRKDMLEFLGRAIVVPDAMTDEAILSLKRRQDQEEESDEETAGGKDIGKSSRPLRLNLKRLVEALEERLGPTSESGGVSIELLEAVQGAIQHGSATGKLPLMTWKEVAQGLDPTEASEPMPPQDIEEAMQGFLTGTGDGAVIMQLSRRRGKDTGREIGSLLLLGYQLSSVWLEPLGGRITETAANQRAAWVSELANDLFLSSHGVAVQDVPLFGHTPPSKAGHSQPSLSSFNHIQSSQPSSSMPSSPVSSDGSTVSPDEALQRLSLLAPSIEVGASGMSKPAAVLDLWPTERGVDPADYISSVATASDRRFDFARQRYQKIENKKKAARERLRPAFKRKGFPDHEQDNLPIRPPIQSSQGPPMIRSDTQAVSSQGPVQNIMSSQGHVPESSQTQSRGGMTMSQVVPGVFGGDRKKAKKPKKRSGFR